MSQTFVALSLFLAASVGFAVPASAQYNNPNNQYNLQRQEGGGGYILPAPAPSDTPMPQDLTQPLNTTQPQLAPQQPLDTPYQIDQGCPSCRVD